MKRFLFILAGAGSLALSRSPREHLRILKSIPKEWEKFERAHIYRVSRSLNRKGLINYQKIRNGQINISINNEGRNYLKYLEFDDMVLPRKEKWDRKWHLILFDIPETKRRGRDALRKKLKELGCHEVQKSIFAWPYDCRKEVNFIVRFFNLENFVIYAEAALDSDSKIKKHFNLA